MKTPVLLTLSCAIFLGALVASEQAQAGSCYTIWAEASGSGSHYRHFVSVENDCEQWLQCTVWTDANPQPPKMLSVAPGAVESAETNGHSPQNDPRAFGACHFK